MKNIVLIIICTILIIVPLVFNSGADFGGADGIALDEIERSNPDYEPWFSSIWEPPSSEIESLIFALQAAIGSGIIFYVFGYLRGKKAYVKN